ncbi:hypothetical protein RP20_CCG011777 [Aedes albopictus]|nr:hypothetical protein RP20_CCG011777 [Aedes albopictus]
MTLRDVQYITQTVTQTRPGVQLDAQTVYSTVQLPAVTQTYCGPQNTYLPAAHDNAIGREGFGGFSPRFNRFF